MKKRRYLVALVLFLIVSNLSWFAWPSSIKESSKDLKSNQSDYIDERFARVETQNKKSTNCIYIFAFGGLTNKLNIVASGRHLANQGYNVCAYLWEDGADQSLPRAENKRFSVPPVKIPYILKEPLGCAHHFTNLSQKMAETVYIPPFSGCLFLDGLLLTNENTIEESHFHSILPMPQTFPDVSMCIHVRNEPDTNHHFDEEELQKLIPQGEKALILGDPKWIDKSFLRNNHYVHTVSSDMTALIAYCICKGLPFYGPRMSSLSLMLCEASSQCHVLKENSYMERFQSEFGKLSISCLAPDAS